MLDTEDMAFGLVLRAEEAIVKKWGDFAKKTL